MADRNRNKKKVLSTWKTRGMRIFEVRIFEIEIFYKISNYWNKFDHIGLNLY